MCRSCNAGTVNYGEIFDDWYIVKATKDDHIDGGMKAGQWGLVIRNDPSFVWEFPPEPEPHLPEDDEREEADQGDASKFTAEDEAWHVWLEHADAISPFYSDDRDMRVTYKLVAAAVEKGYDPEEHGAFEYWLYDFAGKFIESHPDPISKS